MRALHFICKAAVCLAATAGAAAAQGAVSARVESLTLTQALQDAAARYPAVRAAAERLQASTAGVDVARGAYLPKLDAVWQTSRATTNNIFGQVLPQSVIPALTGPVLPTTAMQGAWGSAVGALFSWEAIDFGLRSSEVQEAEADVARARAEQALTQLSVQQAVGLAFLDAVTAQQAVTAANADVERRATLARSAHTLADNQLRAGVEASRADAELASSRTRAIRARQALAVALARLGEMLGLTADLPSIDGTSLLAVSLPPSPPAAMAVGEHPAVTVANAEVTLAQAREAVVSHANRPRLYLQSSVFARGSGANADGSLDGGAAGLGLERINWAAGFQLVVPNVFEFATLRGRRVVVEASTRAEAARLDERVLSVNAQRRTADAIVDAARQVAANTPIQLAAARQSEAQARARYDAGLSSIVEIAEAQSLLAAAEFQDSAARLDVWRALLGQAAANGDVAPFIAQLRAAGVQ